MCRKKITNNVVSITIKNLIQNKYPNEYEEYTREKKKTTLERMNNQIEMYNDRQVITNNDQEVEKCGFKSIFLLIILVGYFVLVYYISFLVFVGDMHKDVCAGIYRLLCLQ